MRLCIDLFTHVAERRTITKSVARDSALIFQAEGCSRSHLVAGSGNSMPSNSDHRTSWRSSGSPQSGLPTSTASGPWGMNREGTRPSAAASRPRLQTVDRQLPYAQPFTSSRGPIEAMQASQRVNTCHTSAPADQRTGNAALQTAPASHGQAGSRDNGQAQLGTVVPSAGRYVPPSMRARISHNLSTSSVNQRRQPQQSEVHEFAVQLFPDMTSLALLDKPAASFYGCQPPEHHTHTAIHDYMAQICPQFHADVWLDTFHTTVGTLYLPLNKVDDFFNQLTQVASGLPDVTSIAYTATGLKQTRKAARINKDEKGELFYHLSLTSAQIEKVLQPWITALQNLAQQLGIRFDAEPFSKHHMTIRCHTVAAVPGRFYGMAVEAVQKNPLAMQIAGLRVQLPRSVAKTLFGETGVRIHTARGACKVEYPVPHYTSAAAVSTMVEQTWTSRTATQGQAGAVEPQADAAPLEGQADAAPLEGQADAAPSEAACPNGKGDQAVCDNGESASGSDIADIANRVSMLALQPEEACPVNVE